MLHIISHEELINIITDTSELNNVNSENRSTLKAKIIILETSLIHNIGIPIIKKTLTTYNKSNHKVIINCGNSLSYCILAIEYNMPYILLNINNNANLKSLIELAYKHGCIIFDSKEKIFAHFNN